MAFTSVKTYYPLVSLMIILSVLFCTSCGSIVKDRSPFTVQSSVETSSIYLNDQKLPSPGIALPSDYRGCIQAKSICRGHKEEYDVILKNRNSITYLLNFLFASYLLDKNPEEYDAYYFIQHRHEMTVREPGMKFIDFGLVEIDIPEQEYLVDACTNAQYQYYQRKGSEETIVNRNIKTEKFYEASKLDTSAVSSLIVSELFDLGYVDTVNFSFNGSSQNLNLNAKISDIRLQIVKVNMAEYFVVASTDIDWIFSDPKVGLVIKRETRAKSGRFLFTTLDMSATLLDYVKLSHVSNTDIKVAIDKAIKDAVKSSIYELLDNRQVKTTLRG